jgi:hypothetical protein
MKKLLMLAAATAAILPMTAQADGNPTATGLVAVDTRVEETCAISELVGLTGVGGASNEFRNSIGGVTAPDQVRVQFQSGDLVDPITARAKSEIQVLKLSAFCNYAVHNVSLESRNGGLTNGAVVASNGAFHNRIAYNAKISNWGSVAGDLAAFSATGDMTKNVSERKRGTSPVDRAVHVTGATAASLTITTVASTVPVLKGDYSDVLTIRLGRGFGS